MQFLVSVAMYLQSSIQLFVVGACSVQGLFNPKYWRDGEASIALPIDISSYYNNRAFAAGPNAANMDGSGSKICSQTLSKSGI